MTFQNYNTANNAIALLDLPITETSNTLTLKGAFDRFPSANFIVKVTQYDINGDVEFRENMLISNRTGGVCAIQTRKLEPVPQDDSALTSVQESYAFGADSVVEVVASSEFYSDIQDELTQVRTDFENADDALNDAKLNKGGLRTSLTNAWKMFFSNGSKNETELSFGPAGTYLGSNGASSAPTWKNPPLDINGQTLATTIDDGDEFGFYNTSTGENNKITSDNLSNSLVEKSFSIEGTPNSVTASIGSDSGTITSTSFQATHYHIANYIVDSSLGVGANYAYLQVSDDNSVWSDLYTDGPKSTDIVRNDILILEKGKYYRTKLIKSFSGGGDMSVTLKYT